MTRQTSTYTNENGSAIEVHRVTESGTVQRVDGSGHEVREGDLIVRQGNPNFWEPVSEDVLAGYSTDDKDAGSDSDAKTVDDSADDFEPSEHRATEVRAYLADRADAGDVDNFNRVTESERAGKNRTSLTLSGEIGVMTVRSNWDWQ